MNRLRTARFSARPGTKCNAQSCAPPSSGGVFHIRASGSRQSKPLTHSRTATDARSATWRASFTGVLVTTIATDGKIMAADGQSTSGDMVTGMEAQKLSRLPDGSIIGGCGEVAPMRRAINCLHSPDAHPDDLTGEFTLLRLFPDGRLVAYEGCLFAFERPAPATIGTGREFAMGAMLAGKGPKEAVEIAIQRDIYSGGTVVVMEPTRPPSSWVELAA